MSGGVVQATGRATAEAVQEVSGCTRSERGAGQLFAGSAGGQGAAGVPEVVAQRGSIHQEVRWMLCRERQRRVVIRKVRRSMGGSIT